ncbi:MAG: hypothetical protein JNK04_23410 [Myxococcales bacterium]|nr:hypothetical protein [Myxococcales bacterium]
MSPFQASIRSLALVLSLASVACDASLSGAPDEEPPVVISTAGGRLTIEAPPGGYNAFDLDVSCSHEDEPGGSFGVWTRAAYGISTNLDCLDCLLPDTVVIGEPVADHEVAACLPSDAHTSCDRTTDIEGLELADLLKPAVLENGEEVPVSGMGVMFLRVYEVYDESLSDQYGVTIPFPRVDTATAELSVTSDGRISVGRGWSFCEDAMNSGYCIE